MNRSMTHPGRSELILSDTIPVTPSISSMVGANPATAANKPTQALAGRSAPRRSPATMAASRNGELPPMGAGTGSRHSVTYRTRSRDQAADWRRNHMQAPPTANGSQPDARSFSASSGTDRFAAKKFCGRYTVAISHFGGCGIIFSIEDHCCAALAAALRFLRRPMATVAVMLKTRLLSGQGGEAAWPSSAAGLHEAMQSCRTVRHHVLDGLGFRAHEGVARDATCSDPRSSALRREIIGVPGPQSARLDVASCPDYLRLSPCWIETGARSSGSAHKT